MASMCFPGTSLHTDCERFKPTHERPAARHRIVAESVAAGPASQKWVFVFQDARTGGFEQIGGETRPSEHRYSRGKKDIVCTPLQKPASFQRKSRKTPFHDAGPLRLGTWQ